METEVELGLSQIAIKLPFSLNDLSEEGQEKYSEYRSRLEEIAEDIPRFPGSEIKGHHDNEFYDFFFVEERDAEELKLRILKDGLSNQVYLDNLS